MDVVGRIAIVTGDMPALEAAIEHMTVLPGLSADTLQALSQLRIATGAIEGAEVEVRQLAFEQMRNVRADRVRIPQQCVAKLLAQARQLTTDRVVIRAPDALQVLRPLFCRRLLASLEQRLALEQGCRVQTCGSTGIQRLVIIWTVQVDDKT
ncbi:hypothetical protein D3C79_794110 [compost metagenome]